MPENLENVLVFRSNVCTASDKYKIGTALDMHPQVHCWSVDLEDEDKVIRVVSPTLNCSHIMDMVKKCGYICEELKD